MSCTNTKPWTNLFTKSTIIGAEGEEDPKGGENDQQVESGDDKSKQGETPRDDEKTGSEPKDDDTSGLKSALAGERARAKAAEKELAKLQKAADEKDLADKSEVEQARIKLEKAEAKAQKLASGFLTSELDRAIRRAAKDFIDPTDAIAGVDRSKLSFTQDEDDPSDIEVDEKSIEKEVKRIAAQKPHFLKTGTTDGDATGGKFGGKPPRERETSADKLKTKYPSL